MKSLQSTGLNFAKLADSLPETHAMVEQDRRSLMPRSHKLQTTNIPAHPAKHEQLVSAASVTKLHLAPGSLAPAGRLKDAYFP